MGNLLPLHRGCRKPWILKNSEKIHDNRNHCDQPECLWCQQSGEHHDIGQVQEELYALRRRSDQPAGDGALPEIRQQMVCCKVLLVVGVGLRSVNRRLYFHGRQRHYRSNHCNFNFARLKLVILL